MNQPVQPNVVYQGDPTLPPAGDERREVLAERKDTLEQKAEELSVNTFTFDPAKLNPDREIRHELSSLHVTNADPAYAYKWVRDANSLTGGPDQQVVRAIGRSVTYDGKVYPTWEIVKGPMVEAAERRQHDGTRRVGDTILLRCHKNTKQIIDYEDSQKSKKMEQAVDSDLKEMAQKYNVPFRSAKQELAKNLSINKFSSDLKAGTVPGMEMT